MTMTDHNGPPAAAPDPKPKPRRKYQRTRKPRAAAPSSDPKSNPAAFLDGITGSACASGCNEKGCVISGSNYCAHPHKGGLQGRDIGDAEKIARYNLARRLLGTEALEKRFGK